MGEVTLEIVVIELRLLKTGTETFVFQKAFGVKIALRYVVENFRKCKYFKAKK